MLCHSNNVHVGERRHSVAILKVHVGERRHSVAVLKVHVGERRDSVAVLKVGDRMSPLPPIKIAVT